MNALERLFKPLTYLYIRHPGKYKYDYWIPFGTALGVCVLIFFLPIRPSLFGTDGLLTSVKDLLQILVGFYIASLAAIATFNRDDMDNLMPGKPLKLTITIRGKTKETELTRRRFLCLMFGYLSFLSIALYGFIALGPIASENIKFIVPIKYHDYLWYLASFAYLCIVFNLMVTTLLGLFYLSDRIHRKDSRLSRREDTDNRDGADEQASAN